MSTTSDIEMDDSVAFARMREAGSGVISDCMLRLGIFGWMDGLGPIGGGERLAIGRARTLLFGPKRAEGTWPKTMYGTIQLLKPGEILVIGAGATEQNLMGDNMATFASLHGLAAVITDSKVRDSAGIAALPMPVYARGPAVRRPLNLEPVALDVPLACAGAQVRSGDVLVASEDGVLVIPASRLADVMYQLDDVASLEVEMAAAILARAPLADIEAIGKRKKLVRP